MQRHETESIADTKTEMTDTIIGDLVQWEHPQNLGRIGVGSFSERKTCNISETEECALSEKKKKKNYDGKIVSRIMLCTLINHTYP